MVVIDRNERQPDTVDDARNPVQRDAESEFSQPHLYRDFPQARHACMHARVGIGDRTQNCRVDRVQRRIQQADEDARIDEQPHG